MESKLLNASPFPTTDWSELDVAAGGGDGALGALGRVVVRYRGALECHLRRRYLLKPEELEDLLQSFLHRKVLEQQLIAQADRSLGRFRTFLLAALDRFVISEFRRAQAQKRQPDGGSVSLDAAVEAGWPLPATEPDIEVEVLWARIVVAEAIEGMRSECQANGRGDLWDLFESRLLRPLLEDEPAEDYENVVTRLGLESPAAAFNLLTTAKRMFRRHLRRVVEDYTQGERAADEELAYLQDRLEGKRPEARPRPSE